MATPFLVSTTHHLLALDPEVHTAWRIHSGSGAYFGLAKGEDGLLYVACRNQIVGDSSEGVRAIQKGTILVLNRGFRVVEVLEPPFPLRDLHGIACFDGCIWATCAHDNMVAICHLATREWACWYPAPDPNDRDHDVHHFNTIQLIDGQVCLVAHHYGPSEVLFYDYPSLQLVSAVPLGSLSHDLFFFKDALATFSSADGCIVNRGGQHLRTGGFPRGIATTPEGNLAGISVDCPHDERQLQDGILRWYTPDWEFKTDFVLPRVGMVHSVLEIGGEGRHWDSLEPWTHLEATPGRYNRVLPGSLCLPDSLTCRTRSADLEWHRGERTHRWMAARDAALSIPVNPGETRLWVELRSAIPGPYHGEIFLDGQLAGKAVFTAPGVERHEFPLPSGCTGFATLAFRVPYLWRPAELIPGSQDERLVGLAVCSIGLG
jgi:hypothetical protein